MLNPVDNQRSHLRDTHTHTQREEKANLSRTELRHLRTIPPSGEMSPQTHGTPHKVQRQLTTQLQTEKQKLQELQGDINRQLGIILPFS